MTVTFSENNAPKKGKKGGKKKKKIVPQEKSNNDESLKVEKQENLPVDKGDNEGEKDDEKKDDSRKVKKRAKKNKKKRKSKKKDANLYKPETYEPCVHLHFKTEYIDRECLTHDQYLEMLATPKGYRWAGEVDCSNPELEINKPKKKRRKRKHICVARPEAGDVDEEFETIWDVVTPEITCLLFEFLVNEFEMSFEEAEDFINCVSGVVKQPVPKKKKTKANTAKYKWAKEYSQVLSEKVELYINTMLTKKRTPRVRKIAEVIIERFCDLTGENISMDRPKKKSHKIMVHIADRLAMWIDDIYIPEEKKKPKEEEIPESEEEEEEGEEEEGEKAKEEEKEEEEEGKEQEEEEEEEEKEEEKEEEPEKEEEKEPEKEKEKEPEKVEEKEPEKEEEKEPEKEEVKEEEKEPKKEEEKEPEKEEEPEEKEEPKEEEKEEATEEKPEEEGEEGEEVVEEEGEEGEGEEEEEEGEEEFEEEPEEVEEGPEEIVSTEKVVEEKPVEEKPIKPRPVPPPRKSPGFAFEVKPKTGSTLQVQKLSSGTVVEVTAKARGVEAPPRGRKVPVSESPLNLKSAEDWADWAEKIGNIADEWGKWLENRLTDAEKQLLDKRKTKSDWKVWRDQAHTEALKWRVEEERIKDEADLWERKIDEKLKDKSETELKTHNLS